MGNAKLECSKRILSWCVETGGLGFRATEGSHLTASAFRADAPKARRVAGPASFASDSRQKQSKSTTENGIAFHDAILSHFGRLTRL